MKKDDIKQEMLRHEYKTEVFVLLESRLANKYLGFVSIRKDLDFIKRSLKYLLEIEETDGRPIKEISGKLHIREHDDFLHCLRQSIYFASVITYGSVLQVPKAGEQNWKKRIFLSMPMKIFCEFMNSLLTFETNTSHMVDLLITRL